MMPVVLRLTLLGLTALASVAVSAWQTPASPPPDATVAETRATAYLAREVPAWRREHPCYSCHNNGDAARALLSVRSRQPAAAAALADTLNWLADPDRWSTNGGGEGGADDKVLARIQFAHGTTAAFVASQVTKGAVERAAAMVASDQRPDGSWQLDSSDSLGSPATYGTALATTVARQTLQAAASAKFESHIESAGRWLARVRPTNTPDAAAVLLAFGDRAPSDLPANWRVALEFLRKGQGRNGGWGPYLTSPAEPFDTALATLTLTSLLKRPALAAPIFDSAALTQGIASGRAYLIAEQLADGSWNETTRPAGQSSYAQRISTTAWALLALSSRLDAER